jgi:hypothetical protein
MTNELSLQVFALSCSIQTLVCMFGNPLDYDLLSLTCMTALEHGWGRHKVNIDAKDLQLVLIVR